MENEEAIMEVVQEDQRVIPRINQANVVDHPAVENTGRSGLRSHRRKSRHGKRKVNLSTSLPIMLSSMRTPNPPRQG